MSAHSPEHPVNITKTLSPGTCYLLKLPLELRDIIYGMLLTTPYCTTLACRTIPTISNDTPCCVLDSEGLPITRDDTESVERYWKFHLHTAVLVVNKQISAEAKRVLYEENDFVLLNIFGMRLWLDQVPAFNCLLEKNITSPVLRIEFSVKDVGHVKEVASQSLLTTTEGLQSIIEALFAQEEGPSDSTHHTTSRLTLDYNSKATRRHRALSGLMMRPWDTIIVKELVLTGDIEEPIREHLEKTNLEGPSPDDVAAHLTEYNTLAKQAFERANYDVAQWWWVFLGRYWQYVSRLSLGSRRICMEDEELCQVLRESHYMSRDGLMKLAKACLRQLRYEEAADYVINASLVRTLVPFWDWVRFGPPLPDIMAMKLRLCACLAKTAQGKTTAAMKDLKTAVQLILDSKGTVHTYIRDKTKLTEDLKQTVDNELIQAKSLWRCNCETPLSSTLQSGSQWEVGAVSRSFWEWMELSENRDESRFE